MSAFLKFMWFLEIIEKDHELSDKDLFSLL